MGLFKKSYKFVTYNDKVSSEINEISDDKRLMEIAIEAKDIKVAEEALKRISDDNYLYDIANSKYFGNPSIQEIALKKIKDEKVINKMLMEFPSTHYYIKKIYDNINNPSFEISITMNSKKAEENLIKDLDKMKYPIDKEKIKLVTKKMNMEEAFRKAIDMLPYEEEHEFIMDLFNNTRSITTKVSIINKMPKEEQRKLLESILETGGDKLIIKVLARNLDKNDSLLEKDVCPNCGAINSMHIFDEYRRSIDMNVRGYCCNKCNFESIEQDGLGELKYPMIKLKEFIER